MDLKNLEELLKEKLKTLNYSLAELKLYYKEGERILSIVVDRKEPIDMEAITSVSEILNPFIDEIDPIEGEYMLEISSLGAEKPLKIEELNDYVNEYVNVHLINPINGENIYEGDLVEVNEESISLLIKIKSRKKTIDIKKENISKIRLAIKF